ncbi:LicD family protein [Clostridium botulinum]|uniref:LicD family protein n=1 Tax=Clostridium botulinum TaxID=1491 RepID=A0A0C2SFH2_CLOBO|nr:MULTISPECIES: LicD family protein [Clostridium]ACD51272.1 LicD family protein [Clostridium botulinum E3 str. Alaska E43]AJF30742.1 lipopolysaccharide cholinephosphotransferase [Clostridium botulinum]AJF33805.1 lipopolysaccharide cholinephosphotransferase [Clostridium botulinum]EES50955.1 LicD family protein [Clostridium botulinum E1 str. 'BoNT E Beluga']KAI3350021.1 LicD family protein [Clostridium botulinum]
MSNIDDISKENYQNKNNDEEYENLSLKDAQMLMVSILKDVHNICEKHGLKYFLDAGTLLGAVRHKGFIPWDDDMDIGMLRDDYEKFLRIAKEELPSHLFLQTFESDKYYDIYQVPCKVRYNGTVLIEKAIGENEKMHNGVYIDIFPYDSLPKHNFVYKIQRSISGNILKSFVRLRDIPEKLTLKNKITFSFYKIITKIFTAKRRRKFFGALVKWNDKNSKYMGYGVDTAWSEYVYKKDDYFDLIKLEFEGENFYGPKNADAILTELYGDYMTLPKEEERVWHAKEIKKLKNI